MKSIPVEKFKLLEKLKENRQKHIDDYTSSLIGWKQETEKFLKDILKDLKKEDGRVGQHWGYKAPQKPETHTQDYDDVIAMVELAHTDTIDVTMEDFQKYFFDRWNWKKDWELLNSAYSVKA